VERKRRTRSRGEGGDQFCNVERERKKGEREKLGLGFKGAVQ